LDYDERVLPSIGNEVLKSIVAQFDAAELITQREIVWSYMKSVLIVGVFKDSGGPVETGK
jgi:prohibitin 1